MKIKNMPTACKESEALLNETVSLWYSYKSRACSLLSHAQIDFLVLGLLGQEDEQSHVMIGHPSSMSYHSDTG